MDIKQDPNSIPNYNSSGRIGELQQHEREQAQSSVLLDSTADGDGAASGELETPDSNPLDDGASPAPAPAPVAGQATAADPRDDAGNADAP